MKKSNVKALVLLGFLTIWIMGCVSAPAPAPSTHTPLPTATLVPTNTPTPTFTQTPAQPPHSLVIIKATLSDNLLGVLIRNTDSDGEPLDTLGLGFLCLSQSLYAVDESGSRLECVQVTDATDAPNQLAIIFSGASPDHEYQIVRGDDTPIDLFPEQIAP